MGLLGIACITLLVVPPPLGASVAGPGSDATAAGYGGGVASPDDEATRVGHAVLAAGGNSTDAAVAAAATLAVRLPAAGGVGGGSALLHVDERDGAVELVDGCAPLGALPAWRTAASRWGTPGVEDPLETAARKASGPVRQSLRQLASESAGALTQGALAPAVERAAAAVGAEPADAAPRVRRESTQDWDGVRVGGGTASGGASVPADAYVSVVVADRWGGVTAVVNSMGRRGGSGAVAQGTGITVGAPLPERCGDALPTVVLREGEHGQPPTAELALAGTSPRKGESDGDPAQGVRDVLDERIGTVGTSAALEQALDAQTAAVVGVELEPDGRVLAAAEQRSGGSAAVVHDD